MLYGVGVGPGDPELLTLKAVRLIQTAQVLAYTVDHIGRSFARKTVTPHIKPGQVELPLFFSMSPQLPERRRTRREAVEKIWKYLHKGIDVVFITEGDPLIYSSFQHLLSGLPAEAAIEICPGISSMLSASASACFPLVIEGRTMIIAPAESARGKLDEWLNLVSSVVLFKASRSLSLLAEEMRKCACFSDAVLVERTSLEGEIVIRKPEEWPKDEAPYFSIVLIHSRN